MKLCKDCIHYSQNIGIGHCNRTFSVSLVDGITIYDRRSCYPERSSGALMSRIFGHCGKAGRFWVEKGTLSDNIR